MEREWWWWAIVVMLVILTLLLALTYSQVHGLITGLNEQPTEESGG